MTAVAKPQMSWEYLTGLFDGEGCIIAKLRNSWAKVAIVIGLRASDRAVLDEAHAFLTSQGIRSAIYTRGDGMVIIQIAQHDNAKAFLYHIRPFSRVKFVQIEKAIQFIENHRWKQGTMSPPNGRRIKWLYGMGASDRQIGSALKLTGATVRRFLDGQELPRRPTPIQMSMSKRY